MSPAHLGHRQSVGEDFAGELEALRSLPDERFEMMLALECRVDHKSRICVRQCFYSVPARYVGRRIDVFLGAEYVEARDNNRGVARHERGIEKGSEHLCLDHYLEVLEKKPGALAGATALQAARSSGSFGPLHERFWITARRKLGDAEGTRALIEVLLAHRHIERVAAAHRHRTGPCDRFGRSGCRPRRSPSLERASEQDAGADRFAAPVRPTRPDPFSL